MSLEGRRTHLIPVLILRQRHFYHASYAHAYSYGYARQLNYGLSSRTKDNRRAHRSITRDSAPFSACVFFGIFFVVSFYLFFFPYEKDTRSGRPRERQRADANEEDSSRLVAGTDSSDSFSLMKESSVRLCN